MRTKEFTVTISYDITKMIEAGRYDWVNSNINEENFPVPKDKTGEEELAIILVSSGRWMKTEKVEKNLKENNLRPATFPELLALGAKHPDDQREAPIVALGSVWRNPDPDGFHSFLCLDGDLGNYRDLDLCWSEGDWPDFWLFAAVRT